MRLFKRQGAKSLKPKKEAEIGEFKLTYTWNDKLAGYHYVLWVYWFDVSMYVPMYYWEPRENGDLKWAKRIANHYKLQVPTTDNEESRAA